MNKHRMHNARVYAAHLERERKAVRRLLRNDREAAFALERTPEAIPAKQEAPRRVDWYCIAGRLAALVFTAAAWRDIYAAVRWMFGG